MSLQRMRQHIGAVVWHAREAIAEAPGREYIHPLIHQVDVTGLDSLTDDDGNVISLIEEGYVREAANRDTHILPEEVFPGKQS